METGTIDTFKEKMETKLKQVGLPFYDLKVYGVTNVNIMLTIEGFETTNKWLDILSRFCRKIRHGKTIIYNKVNKNTCLLPSRRKAYSIWAIV